MKISWINKVEKSFISIVNQWIDEGIIEAADASIYLFGLKEGSWFLLNVLMTLFLGLLVRDIKSAFWFLLFFFPLRRFAGGFHAKTRERCFFISVFIVIIALSTMDLLNALNTGWKVCLIMVSSIGMLKWGPIENSRNPLSIAKYKQYRRFLILSVLCEWMGGFILIGLGENQGVTYITIAFVISFGLCLMDMLLSYLRQA